MKKGFIKKQISNQYTIVDLETHDEMLAQARGKLRYLKLDEESSFNRQTTKKTKIEQKIAQVNPKVGDHVMYDMKDEKVLIHEILPRKNDLIRPDVANIDQAILVFSAVNPDFSFLLLDKFLVIMSQENLTPILVVSKIDLIEQHALTILKEKLTYYQDMGLETYYVNSKQKIGFDVLEHVFAHKLSVLAGQTGVGKSTLLNGLMPELGLKTQEISKALGRGKHTTRHTELYSFNEGYIVDTPGFSKIELSLFYPEDLKPHYPDFIKLGSECRFGFTCLHDKEPGCAVKEAVETGAIPLERHQNYLQFLDEIKNQKEKY